MVLRIYIVLSSYNEDPTLSKIKLIFFSHQNTPTHWWNICQIKPKCNWKLKMLFSLLFPFMTLTLDFLHGMASFLLHIDNFWGKLNYTRANYDTTIITTNSCTTSAIHWIPVMWHEVYWRQCKLPSLKCFNFFGDFNHAIIYSCDFLRL